MKEKLEHVRKAADMAVIKARCKFLTVAGVAGGVLSDSICVFADNEKNSGKTVDSGANADNTFDFLTNGTNKNNSIDGMTSTFQGLGFSIYNLLLVIGAICTVCCLVWTGICIIANKNAAKRDENKGHLLYIALGATLIFGAITFAAGLKSFAGNISLA